MKTLIIIGIVLFGFGLLNLFWYMPYSLTLLNQPFPFEYLQEVELHDGGIGVSIWYEPFEVIKHYPYWLAWSLSLYSGLVILAIPIVRSGVRKNEN